LLLAFARLENRSYVAVDGSPGNTVAQLNPKALGSLFMASYYSQGYGEGIRTRFHTGSLSQYCLGTVCIGSTAPNSFSVAVARRCLVMARLVIETFPRKGQCLSSHVAIL
jgi:hypothetical protein